MRPERIRYSMLWTPIYYEFDLSKPIWLDHNIDEFKDMTETRFYQDNFVGIPLILIIWRFILLKNKLCINEKEVRRPPFTEGLPDFFLMFYSFPDRRKRTQLHCPFRREISRQHSDQHCKYHGHQHKPPRNIRYRAVCFPHRHKAPLLPTIILMAADITKLRIFPAIPPRRP